MPARLRMLLLIGGLVVVAIAIGFALLNGPLRPRYADPKTEHVEVNIVSAPPPPPATNAAK